jgi:hypothetical protein
VIMKSLFSVLGLVGFVLVMASGCGDDDIVIDPDPPPAGDAGPEPTLDAGSLDAGEILDATVPDIEVDASPIGDAASEVPVDADIADADVDAGDAQ